MKPIDAKNNTYINIDKEVNDKDPKFQIGDHIKHQNTKIFLLRAILQTGQKKFL